MNKLTKVMLALLVGASVLFVFIYSKYQTNYTVQDSKVEDKHPLKDYVVLKFGATWCPPCVKMKKEVWRHPEIRDLIGKTMNGKTYEFDWDRERDKPYFKGYKVELLPTIFLLRYDSVKEKYFFHKKHVGFMSVKQLKKFLDVKDEHNTKPDTKRKN